MHDRHANTLLISVHLLIRMLYANGIRIEEAIHLNVEDVNLEENYLVVKEGKNGKDRMVPFSKEATGLLKKYMESYHLLEPYANE